MDNIRELLVVQVRLFRVDAIRLDAFASPSTREGLTQKFGFRASSGGYSPLPIQGVQQAVVFQDGEFESQGSRIGIRSIEIEPRRILTRISGESSAANEFFDQFLEVVKSTASVDLSSAIYTAEETTCIANLNLDFGNLLNPKISDFLTKRLSEAASVFGTVANANPSRIVARLTFDVQDGSLRDHGITVNPKEFIIEPRQNTPSDDRIFLTKSPLPSEIHFALLEELEELLSGTGIPV